jgi:protein O-mannosyl-transferase
MIKKYIRSTQAKSIFVLLLFLFIGFAIYSNTFRSPFVFDDLTAITGNPNGRLKELSWEGLSKVLNGAAANRPVPMLSFALNYFFNQYRVVGYHAVNILIHVLNGFLLFVFVRKTLVLSIGEGSEISPIRSRAIAFFCALIWLVHPLQTQSVTYVYQRMNSMAALFYLLSILCYVNGRICQRPPGSESQWAGNLRKNAVIYFVSSIIFGLLALGSKEISATLPFFIILYEWSFFQNQGKGWLKKNAVWIVLAFIPGMVLFWITVSLEDPGSRYANVSQWNLLPADRLLTSSRVVVYYLSLLVFPHPSRLNLDYDFPLSFSLIDPWTTLPSAILILLLIGLAVFSIRRYRLLFFCVIWFLGNLAIESTVIPLQDIIFEHRLYLPSMILGLPLLVFIDRRVKNLWIPGLVICLTAVVFSYWTYQRNKVWQNEMSLWADNVKKSPNKARPHNNLGLAFQNQGNIEKALFHYTTASQLDPTSYVAHNNLGNIYMDQGNLEKAFFHLSGALKIRPGYSNARINMGRYYYLKGDSKTALDHYSKVLAANPLNEVAHNNAGNILVQQEKLDEAKHHFLRAMEINPHYIDPVIGFGHLLVKNNKLQGGIGYFQKALDIDPGNYLAHFSLGNVFLNIGNLEKAIYHLKEVIARQPEFAMAYNNLAVAFEGKGLKEESVEHYRKALKIDPQFSAARENLKAFLKLQENDRKIVEAKKPDNRKSEAGLPAKENHSDQVKALFEQGNLLLRKGDLEKAADRFLAVINLETAHKEAYNNLGVVRFRQGRIEDAKKAFQKVLEIDPAYKGARFNLDRISGLKGNK